MKIDLKTLKAGDTVKFRIGIEAIMDSDLVVEPFWVHWRGMHWKLNGSFENDPHARPFDIIGITCIPEKDIPND